MKSLVKRLLSRLGLYKQINAWRFWSMFFKQKPTYTADQLLTFVNADFLDDEKFVKSYKLAQSLMMDNWDHYDFSWRAYILCWAGLQASKLDGDFVDCGASVGMFARMIINFADLKNHKINYYLLDTFKGADPKYSTKEEYKKIKGMGYHDVYDQVKETFKQFDFVKIIKGPIPETLSQVPSEKIAFLSIDMNCELPEREALKHFWPKLVTGAIVVFDDYGFKGHENQKKSHDNFVKEKGLAIMPLPTGQGILIKP